MKKATAIALLIMFAANASAQIALVEPANGAIVELAAAPGQQTSLEIIVENAGEETIQGIIPQTDLNASFSPASFGLEPNKQKTITMTLAVEENTEGTISIGEQSFTVKINIIEEKDLIDELLEKVETHEKAVQIINQTITTGVMAGLAIVLVSIVIKKAM